MKRIGPFGSCCLLLVTIGACKVDGPSLSDDGPERSCQAPRLTVIGHEKGHGPLSVRPGQTLRVHGVHYTDDCASNGAGTGKTIPRLQLALRSRMRMGALVTVHPHGPDAAFTASVTIPSTTFPGPARLVDLLSVPHGVVRLVVRR
jgi:hypothetical protein